MSVAAGAGVGQHALGRAPQGRGDVVQEQQQMGGIGGLGGTVGGPNDWGSTSTATWAL